MLKTLNRKTTKFWLKTEAVLCGSKNLNSDPLVDPDDPWNQYAMTQFLIFFLGLSWNGVSTSSTSDITSSAKRKALVKLVNNSPEKILTSRSKPYNGPNSFNSLNILKHHRIQRKCHGFGYMTWHIATNSITTINLITNPKNIIR